MNFEHVSDSVDCIDMQVEWRDMFTNKEVSVNIELFLLVFVHEKSTRRCGLLKVGKYALRDVW